MSFIGWKGKTSNSSTPGASPTQTSPLGSLHNNANSVNGLGPLGSLNSNSNNNNNSTSSSSSSSLLASVQPIQVINNNSPPLSSSNSININSTNNTTATTAPLSISSNSSTPSQSGGYDTIGKSSSSSISIDTSQFNNNYVGTTQVFGGQPINPNTDLGSSILNKFSKFLLSKGFNTEGIFKPHPELENEIQNVKKNLLKDLTIGDMEQVHLPTLTQNPLVIAELMKQYLALLPEPLFSFQLYDSFLLTHSILSPNDRIWAYRFLLLYLPIGFRGAIKSVLGLLSKIHQNFESSKMNSECLAKIFSPVFLRPEEEMYYMKSDQPTLEEIVKLWIEEFDTISKPLPISNPNSKVTILGTSSSSTPSIQQHLLQQQQQFNSLPNINSSGGNVNSNNSNHHHHHPTIGLNKIQPQSPKLSLPTISKDNLKQQQMTIIKPKPILSSAEPIKSKQATPSPSPSLPTTTITTTTTIDITPISSPVPTKRSSVSSPSPSNSSSSITAPLSPSSSGVSEQEVEEKVKKIKISIENSASEQALLQIKNLLKSIEKEFNYNHIIKFSSILRDAKKHMNESTEKLLSLNKSNVRELIQEYPKPVSYNLLVSSMPILDSTTITVQEKKVNDLKRASQVAADEISDYIYYLKLKIDTFPLKEQVISTAQIFSKLKSILESPPPPLITANSWTGELDSNTINNINNIKNLNISNNSPTTSPSMGRNNRQSLNITENQISADKATIRIIEVSKQEIINKLNIMRSNLETTDINGAFEIGKNLRSVKSNLNELYTQCKLIPPPEVKSNTTPGDDQLTTLRKALPPLLDRFIFQIDELSQRVINNNNSNNVASPEEVTIIVDKLLFLNRTLGNNNF